jgi:zinc transport system permease protein
MINIFNYQFLINSVIIGLITAFTAPSIGIFLVVKRYSALADTLAHVSLVGIVVAIVLGFNPILSAAITTIICVLSIELLKKKSTTFSDGILTLFLTTGLGLATVITSYYKNIAININSYLFGSINTVSLNDIFIAITISIFVLTIQYFIYPKLYIISLDEDIATSQGINVQLYNYIFLFNSALIIALSIQTIGILLISSLMIVPCLTAMKFGKSFKITLLIATILSCISVLIGILISYNFNLATSGVIVCINTILYLLCSQK